MNVHCVLSENFLEGHELCTLDTIDDGVGDDASAHVVVGIGEHEKRVEPDLEKVCLRCPRGVQSGEKLEDTVHHHVDFGLDVVRVVALVVNGNHEEIIADGKRKEIKRSVCLDLLKQDEIGGVPAINRGVGLGRVIHCHPFGHKQVESRIKIEKVNSSCGRGPEGVILNKTLFVAGGDIAIDVGRKVVLLRVVVDGEREKSVVVRELYVVHVEYPVYRNLVPHEKTARVLVPGVQLGTLVGRLSASRFIVIPDEHVMLSVMFENFERGCGDVTDRLGVIQALGVENLVDHDTTVDVMGSFQNHAKEVS